MGGGKGNLSFILCKEQNISALSVDMEEKFQIDGQKRNEKQLKEKAGMITFKNHFFSPDVPFDGFKNHDLSVGLHTCGPLSKLQFDHSIAAEQPFILNFACCYHRLSEDGINIS